MTKRPINPLLLSMTVLFLLALPCFGAANSPEEPQDLPVHVSPSLKESGLAVGNATTHPKGERGTKDAAPRVVVFITFAAPFSGKLYLCGYNASDTEIVRSALLPVQKAMNEGGHEHFTFDADSSFTKVKRFSLMGEKRTTPPPRKPAPEESFGEKATNIVKELLE